MKQAITAILLGAALSLMVSTVGWVHAGEKEKVKADLEEIRDEKSDIQEDLDEIEKDMKQNRQLIEDLEKNMARIDQEVAAIESKMAGIIKEENHYKEIFKKRIRKLYQQGEVGYMVSLLESRSFEEFLGRFESIRLIVKRDHSLFARYAELRAEKEKRKKQLIDLREQQKKMVAKASEAYKQLASDMKKKRIRLANLENLEEIKESEIRRINLSLARKGLLSFPYEGGPLKWPAASGRVTSPFGMRYHPVTGTYRMHTGIDIGGNYDTPVYAAASGVVVESRPSTGYGWIIVIYHGNKNGTPLYTWYAHSYPRQVRVQEGDEVKRGQRITGIGSNGMSTGNHLHFEVRIGKNGQAVNPMPYFN